MLASIATDLGRADRLSEGQKQIARRCAMLSVECEIMESAAVAGEPFDLDVYGQLTDRLGRAFQRLGLKRVMHDVTPDLGAYLTATATGKSHDGSARSPPPDNGCGSRNGRQRPTSSIGDHDSFRHHAPGPERQCLRSSLRRAASTAVSPTRRIGRMERYCAGPRLDLFACEHNDQKQAGQRPGIPIGYLIGFGDNGDDLELHNAYFMIRDAVSFLHRKLEEKS